MRRYLIPLLLVIACVLVYAQVRNFQFVNFDDEDYIYKNPHVLAGLHWQTIAWAFTTGWASNYHPLTWISLALDVSVFGLNPKGFHLENVLFHIVNALLLLRFMRRATGDYWLSVFIAFVFALHPTHVESVAWVTERKDVLSTFFLLLAMLAYLRYTATGSIRAYIWMSICLAISLLAKQMGVTLPIVLLLLDYWPLRRSQIGFWKRVREKIPLLLLSIAACVATFIAQHLGGAVATFTGLPISYRLQSIPIAYVIYLRQTFWPADLSAFYPYRSSYATESVIGSVLLLLAITFICLLQRRRRPYLLVGWLWFTLMMVPVIGLVQIGSALTADRYLYMPSVGLTIMLAGLVKQRAQNSRLLKRLTVATAVVVIIVLAKLSYDQTGYWQNTITLKTRALMLMNHGSDLHMQLAKLYESENHPDAARREYSIAAQMAPNNFVPEFDLGNLELTLRDPPQAIAHYQRALQLQPGNPRVENNLAHAWLDAGRPDDAIAAFRSAVEYDPGYVAARLGLAGVLESQNLPRQAREQYQAVLKLDPANAAAQAGLARLR